MASVYPGALDSLATNHSDTEAMLGVHAQVHNDLADAVNKIELENGINPSGIYADIAARLAIPRTASFSKSGVLAVGVGAGRFMVPFACTIAHVRAVVNGAPVGAAILVDVNKNGTTIFTTQANRPSIAAAGFSSAKKTPDVTSMADGDYFTVDVDQVGSTTPGSDLTVIIAYVV